MLLQHARRNLCYPSIFKLWWFWSVGYIATIPLIGNMRKITGPLLLAWKSTRHSLFHRCGGSRCACWFHAGRTASIKVDHSLDWPGHSKSWFLAVSGIHGSPVVLSINPDFGAPQLPIPMRKSWCATLIWRKGKEGYRAPWLSKECIFFREDSGKSIAIGISLPWYAQDSRGGCDSKFPFLSFFPKQKQTFDKFWIVNFSFTISIRNSHLKISKL